MKKTNYLKLAIAGVFCAVAVVGSMLSFPVLGSKCSPVQHMVNILCAVLLGPWYGVGAAFAASLIRNLTGLGSLLAFPGSMIGALLCGLVYAKTKNILATLAGEVFGTAVLGGLCAYPIAILFMGKKAGEIAFYAYIVPFRNKGKATATFVIGYKGMTQLCLRTGAYKCVPDAVDVREGELVSYDV